MADTVFFQIAPEDRELTPARQHESDAAFDLRSRVDDSLAPGEWKAIPTGVKMQLPPDFVADVRPRSGLALKQGVTVLNTPGTIDSGYRGEVQVILINHGARPFPIHRGDRIAQMVFLRLPQVQVVLTDALDASERGEGGFGSTGRR
ncbi:MAG: dUTP diphosphatase [Oligosphaeraceae bacterium]